MNAFYEHHQDSIQFRYRCFDRILLNGLIQPFQQPERVLGFFNAYREGKRVTRRALTEIADQFQYWLKNRSEKWGAPLVEAPDEGRRDDFVHQYLRGCPSDRVAVILKAQDLLRCGQKWLAAFTPFFTPSERQSAGCQHRLFVSQVEYCDNLIFSRRAAVDQLTQRLLDLNQTLGQPKKITLIFGRKVTKQYKGKLQTVIEDLDLPNPVIRSHYGHGSAKQYVRDNRLLRTEPATNNVYDYGANKKVENLPRLRERMSEIIDNYQNVQQDILETFVDRGQLRQLAEPTR